MRLMTDLSENLVALAEQLARNAGSLALAGRKKGLTEVDTKSTATDMVTEFDLAHTMRLLVKRARATMEHQVFHGLWIPLMGPPIFSTTCRTGAFQLGQKMPTEPCAAWCTSPPLMRCSPQRVEVVHG